jgi:hypothetical protein
MTGHQEAIEKLEESKNEIQTRESAADQELKGAKKSLVKANQELTAAEKVCAFFSFFSCCSYSLFFFLGSWSFYSIIIIMNMNTDFATIQKRVG